MQIHPVGIDLGKTTFQRAALSEAGKVLVRKKFSRRQLLTNTANVQTSLIGLEARSGGPCLRQAGPCCAVDRSSVREALWDRNWPLG